jgi:GWxTD domain-containing protein
MKKIFVLSAFLIFMCSNYFAQNQLKFDLDYAKFHYDSSSVYTELYYQLNVDGMQTLEANNKLSVEAIIHISIKNTTADTFLVNKRWRLEQVVNPGDSSQLNNSLVGVLGFIIPKGVYSLTVEATDSRNPVLKKIINEKIVVEPYKNDKYYISDIELARNIKNDGVDKNSLFYKNTLEVMPNPSIVYDENSPVLFFYSELYNLKLADNKTDFVLQKTVYNSKGNSVYTATKSAKQSLNSVVEIGTINLSKLPTDTYELRMSLIDPNTKKAYLSSKRFFLYNPKVKETSVSSQTSSNVLGSEFALMTLEDCDEIFSQMKYISTQGENDRYSKLDSLKAKQEFLFNFWRTRDTDPSTPKNEFKEDYMRRVTYANEHFRLNAKAGYKTDRGRILLMYGEPDTKDLYSSGSDLKPYEIWFYNQIEGGVTFVFGDPTGYGNFELLNSTKRGEYRDDNWQQRLKTQ